MSNLNSTLKLTLAVIIAMPVILVGWASDDKFLGPFNDDSGQVQSLAKPSLGDPRNSFFAASVGTNGQACVTCHQPDQAFSIQVDRIRKAFAASKGMDPLFRLDDTADRPDAVVSSLKAREKAYKLFLDLGVVRIAKTFRENTDPDKPTTKSDFRVEHQKTSQFGPLPGAVDPQHPGMPVLSLFRRPLVNTNMDFDSAVLWDGRDSMSTLAEGQVPKAIQSLLLGPGNDKKANKEIADFMTGVFTDQISDTAAKSLAEQGASGGVQNLLAMSSDPRRPCLFVAAFPTPGAPTLTPLSPSGCTRIDDNNARTFGMGLFDAWLNLPGTDDVTAARKAIARGEEIFNHANLRQPPDLNGKLLDVGSTANGGANPDHPDRIAADAPIHCNTCHAARNLGNNPNPNFIGRIGTDSIDILQALVGTRGKQDPLVKDVLDNVKKLPLYCLRPNSDTASFKSAKCGTHPGDLKTTDPGRAMVTGLIADAGKFKPPILLNLSGRAPFFHAGTAKTVFELIDFYDARFAINLTHEQKADLAKFLNAL